jgi:hypothetical protein
MAALLRLPGEIMSFDVLRLDQDEQDIYQEILDRLGTKAKKGLDQLCEAIWDDDRSEGLLESI